MMKPSFKKTAAIVGLGFLLYGLQVFSPYWLHPVLYWSLPIFHLVFHSFRGCPNPGACVLALMVNAILISVIICLLVSKTWRQPEPIPNEASSPVVNPAQGKAWLQTLKLARHVAGIQILGFVALAFVPLVNIVLLVPMAHLTNPGPFDRPFLEAVVAQVRLAGLKPEEQREFCLDDPANPKLLRPLDPNRKRGINHGYGPGDVLAEVSSENKLKVVITTRTMGHMGTYGFAYSDVILTPKPMDDSNDSFSIEVPGSLNYWGLNWVRSGMRIDDHWWRVQSMD